MSSSQVFEILARLRQPVWVFDIDRGRVVWSNAGGLAVWNAESLDELAARDMSTDLSPEVANRLRQYQRDFLKDPDIDFREVWTLYPQGEPCTLDLVYTAFVLDDGRMAMMVEALQEHPLDADGLRSAEALLHTPVMITLYDQTGRALYRNPSARSALLESADTLAARFVDADAHAQLFMDLCDEGIANVTACVRTSQGPRWHDVSARRCHDAVSGDTAWLVSEVDVSGLKETEERAQFLAHHDGLTRLPNRNHLALSFPAQLEVIRRSHRQGAVIFIDLDHFKNVNDTLGHSAGDQLLVETARRLRNVVRQDDLVARLGGDEFLVLVSANDIIEHVCALSLRITQALSEPIKLLGREARITPTLGVSLYPQHGEDMETLMRHADLAVYKAKDKGRNTMAFFSEELNDTVQTRVLLESEIREGLERDEFFAVFQPRARVADNVISGAEALARWRHPERGILGADEFISIVEELGLIGQLGLGIFDKAVQQQRRWAAQGHDLIVSVNLSPLQIAESGLVDDLCRVLDRHGAEACHFELEITESTLLGHERGTVESLDALSQVGFRIAIDDFGTGYSNLAYLHRYRLDCLKIDRSFIGALDDARAITELIVSMAKLLDLTIVAEGVESDSQLAWLNSRECHEYQGYLLSRPLVAREFDRFLGQNRVLNGEVLRQVAAQS